MHLSGTQNGEARRFPNQVLVEKHHYQTMWKSSCEEILTSDSRDSVSDASSMIQTFRTFFMGWVENSKRPSNRQLANWLRRRPRASSKVSSLEEAMTSSISTNAVFSWRNVAWPCWPCHDLARSPHQLGKIWQDFSCGYKDRFPAA